MAQPGDPIPPLPWVQCQFRVLTSGEWQFVDIGSDLESWFEVTLQQAPAVLTQYVVEDDRAAHRATLAHSLKTLTPWVHEHRIHSASGELKWVRGQAIPQVMPDGSVLWHGILTDISGQKQLEAAWRTSEKRFHSIFDKAYTAMAVTDKHGVVTDANASLARLLRYTRQELVGMHVGQFTHPDDIAKEWNFMQEVFAGRRDDYRLEKRFVTASGALIWADLLVTIVRDEQGQMVSAIGLAVDISERKLAADKIEHLAFYDGLTELPNRRLMLDRLAQALTSSARRQRHGALMLIDLDSFKTLNDTHGHAVGDQLLVKVAMRLKACIRQDDTVARVGGDEFVVILKDLDASALAASHAENVASKILTVLGEPYALDASAGSGAARLRSHHCTSSIGISLFHDASISVDELLRRADTAMYQAKAAGRNTLRFFDTVMQAAVNARAALEFDLRAALMEKQFLLHYQAQVDASGRVVGAEALVRWLHPERGLVPPVEFIGLAEDTGLILPLGLWVLEAACAQLANWALCPDTAHLSLAVNVSARQFGRPEFVDQVLGTLRQSGARPERLKLELTEGLLLDHVEEVIEKMIALKSRGVGFSMDDFGTGYSSLSYLKRLPLDQLKIDQSFVRDVLTDPNDAAIARTVVALGQSLGLAVIAEGVETQGQRDFLAAHGCLTYQGYFFSRPLPLAGFEAYLRRC